MLVGHLFITMLVCPVTSHHCIHVQAFCQITCMLNPPLAEFQRAVQNDGDRLKRLIHVASVARPGHSFTNFVWGNRDSLKEQPHKDLHKDLNTYYTLLIT